MGWTDDVTMCASSRPRAFLRDICQQRADPEEEEASAADEEHPSFRARMRTDGGCVRERGDPPTGGCDQ